MSVLSETERKIETEIRIELCRLLGLDPGQVESLAADVTPSACLIVARLSIPMTPHDFEQALATASELARNRVLGEDVPPHR